MTEQQQEELLGLIEHGYKVAKVCKATYHEKHVMLFVQELTDIHMLLSESTQMHIKALSAVAVATRYNKVIEKFLNNRHKPVLYIVK